MLFDGAPRALREHGYTRARLHASTATHVSRPLFFGLEGRPCIARGEPRFAAEPREYGWANVRGRAQDNDSNRRSPSPQQPEFGLVGLRIAGDVTLSAHDGWPLLPSHPQKHVVWPHRIRIELWRWHVPTNERLLQCTE